VTLLGLDLGGTNIKVSIMEPDSDGYHVVFVEERPTRAGQGPETVAANLVEAARGHIRDGTIGSIGLGVPGLFDLATGVIELFPNLPGNGRDSRCGRRSSKPSTPRSR
jgi:predicted NBD/HSP70 family sugar kinase